MDALYVIQGSLYLGFTLVLAYLLVNEIWRYSLRIKGLSGPRGIPVIGNIHQIKSISPAEQYRRWAKQYGAVFQIQLGNRPVVVVNSAAAAKNLFLSQGSALNSRPTFYVFHKLVSGQITSIGTSPWNETVKARRKAAASALNLAKTESYFPIIRRESRVLMQEILETGTASRPLDYHPIVQRFSLNLVLSLNYGSRLSTSKGELERQKQISFIEGEISRLRSVSSNMPNYVPILRIPLWFKRDSQYAAGIGRQREEYNAKLLAELEKRVQAGTDIPCIQGNVLKDKAASLNPDDMISISLSMMAGSETNTPTIEWACILLSRLPSIQRKAYEAIVNSQGPDFDPLLTADVPYVMALAKEVLRYYTPLRLALPRETWRDAFWNGTKIPKGSMVFLNAWACNRDPDVLQEPDTFSPERWLEASEAGGLSTFAFGYGQRMCVASHLANRAVYIVILHLVANFKILRGEDNSSELGDDVYDDMMDPLKGIKDPSAQAARPNLVPLKFVPRDANRLRQSLKNKNNEIH